MKKIVLLAVAASIVVACSSKKTHSTSAAPTAIVKKESMSKVTGDTVSLPSGLRYKVLAEGLGRIPKITDKVKVHYHGTLDDGTVFDSSVKRGKPLEFRLNQVIAGWQEGLQLMKEGAIYDLYIPSKLGYGSRGAGKIPPFANLTFRVELLEIL
mgnify:CR=1 FL=1